MTNRGQRFFGVQILRAIAALMVVAHHAAQMAGSAVIGGSLPDALINGGFGVDIFFSISGMVMFITAESMARRQGPEHGWKEFLWRRALRVIPLYYLFTGLKLGLNALWPSMMAHYRFSLWHTVASFLFVPAYNAEGEALPIMPVGWTLNYEILFYLIVGAALLLRKHVVLFTAAVMVTLALIGLVIPHAWGGATYIADPIELEFVGGMLIGMLVLNGHRLPAWVAITTFGVALVLALSLDQTAHRIEFSAMRCVTWGIPGALMLLATASLETKIDFQRRRFLLLLGDSSYVLYLSHAFVVAAIGVLAKRWGWTGVGAGWTLFAASIVVSVAVAVPLHWWLEKPLLRLFGERRMPWSVVSSEST